MTGKEGGYGAVDALGRKIEEVDPYYDVEADEEVCRMPADGVRHRVPVPDVRRHGFGTGWSSNDSIFKELNKFIERYDDLQFAGDLVFASSCAASIVLVLAFVGQCCNLPCDLRSLGFPEGRYRPCSR